MVGLDRGLCQAPAMTVVLVALGLAAFLLAMFGGTTIYDRRVAASARPWFGTGAGVHTTPLRPSTLLAERLSQVQWRRAARRGINHGRCLLDDDGLHWSPSLLTNKRVPPFDIAWPEVREYAVSPGRHILGRQVAQVELTLADGTPLRLASSDPDGWVTALSSYVTR
jgi:hypothetical protein